MKPATKRLINKCPANTSESLICTITTVSESAPTANLRFTGFAFYDGGTPVPSTALSEFTALASEEALARLWDNPAEDEAWRDL